MEAVSSLTSRWSMKLHRRFSFLRPSNVVLAAVVVAAFSGLASLALGQDRNWDLRNYHLYNAYAYLTDRIGVDLAPAGLQSYFPPLLDVPYLWLVTHCSGATVALVMGLIHGLNFILLAGIAWVLLKDDPRRASRAPVLGLLGFLSAVFLSELGNTMGDNTTAPLLLGALLLIMDKGDRRPALGRFVGSGVLLGFAIGLKLTNAPYAVALAGAVLVGGGHWLRRAGALATVTVSAFAAFTALTGAWFYRMWEVFGNPLLPQFNTWFQSPIAAQTTLADTRWVPDSFGEAVAWPVLMTLDPGRVGEMKIDQIVWLALYALLAAWAVCALFRRGRPVNEGTVHARSGNQVLVFVGVAFVVWMVVFSIHRYLVVAEMLAPLAIWVVAHRAFSPSFGPKVAKGAVVASALFAVVGWNTWGNTGLSSTAFRVEVPEQGSTLPASVLMAGDEPMAWMLPFLPAQYRFVELGASFPEGPGYQPRVREIWRSTPGRVFALLPATDDRKLLRAERVNRTLERWGVDEHCDRLGWLAKRMKLEVTKSDVTMGSRCRLSPPAGQRMDIVAEDRRLQEAVAKALSQYGIALQGGSCQRKQASIGADQFSYQWCRLAVE